MLENARRQTIFVLLVSLVAIGFLFRPYILGLDLKGGTQLVLEVNKERAIADGAVEKGADWNKIMEDTVRIIHERIDPSGTKESVVTKRGDAGILVELPATRDTAEKDAIVQRILTLGRLEERVVARDDYSKKGVKFELTKEKERLEKWLDKDTNREILGRDPLKISLYHSLSTDDGGRLERQWLKWSPRKVKPKKVKGGKLVWDRSYSEVDLLSPATVKVFKPEATSKEPTSEAEFLIEYIAINMHERMFEGSNMDPSQVAVTLDNEGGNAVAYAMKAMFSDDYVEWSREYIGKCAAIILNDFVESAPRFESAITGGRGQIHGSFTHFEAQGLANVLKTGSLQVLPELQSETTIGATLGEQALQKGLISILIGGLLVIVFMFWYYRMSGLVANLALALNLLLIIGVMQFIRATYTLPGLAGIVLTLGMAVDANILIYERIREELARGKATLQAIRAGFDRALVTILDANITTFMAGIVLYNVGIGPIRGFAVTLNVGIVTTVFTAFFVSRLLFHFLLARQQLKEIKMRSMFTNVNVDWLGAVKYAVGLSSTIIVLGLINFFVFVPSDVSMGIDFKGGASLTVALEKPMKTSEFTKVLGDDAEFKKLFHSPLVTTAGVTDASGAANQFSVKLKLTDALSKRLDQETAAAMAKGIQKPEPFYVTELKRVLQGRLVGAALSNVERTPGLEGSGFDFAKFDVNFVSPVKLSELEKALVVGDTRLPGAKVTAPAGQNPDSLRVARIEFDVESTTKTEALTPVVAKSIAVVKDVSGAPARLSDPIPAAERIGGRMVSELRNAAIGSIILSLFLIGMYVRVRFHEYKYGIAAAAGLLHDLLVSFGFVVFFNAIGLVNVELDLGMIAAFLTVLGYSINDTIVVFDRFRENLNDQKRLGDSKESFRHILNRSINQTMSRTVWTTSTVLFVVIAQFIVNYGVGSSLEGFSFCLLVGVASGVYSTIYVCTPVVLWLHNREERAKAKSVGEAVVTTAKA